MLDWKQCEGELAGGEFPLERYLGGSGGSAVFLTRYASGRAAIKLVLAGQAPVEELVKRWNRAATLYHPHLVRIFAAGTWVLAGMPLAYLVMEYAEENLAEVLRERPLTTNETRELLEPVADALAYLHGQGLVQGNLKPSNILAVNDTVKISSEALSAGDPAEDIWALGVTLVQALTQQAATVTQSGQRPAVDAVPFPFREMAQNCLHHDPQLRWSAGKIGVWLGSPEWPPSTLPAPAAKRSRLRNYVAVTLVVVGAAIVGGLLMHRTAAPVLPAAKPVLPARASSPPAPVPIGQTVAPKDTAAVPPDRGAEPLRGMGAARDGVMRRLLPDIPAKARNTVHGKATVVVRVAVDPSGNVTQAALEPGGSPYFGKLALEAAKHWQFASVQSTEPRSWILRFEITRTATQVVPHRADRE